MGNWRCANITKSIISGFEIVFEFQSMILRAHVSFVPFAFGAVVELALLAAPGNLGLAFLNALITDNTYPGIRWGRLVENIFWVFLNGQVVHDMPIIAQILCSFFTA